MSYLLFLAFGVILLLVRQLTLQHRQLHLYKADLDALEASQTSLQQSAFTQQKLLSLISHHIRGPFHFVLRMVTLLNEKWELLEEKDRRNSLRMMHNSLDEMDRTLRDVIDWAKQKQTGHGQELQSCNTGDIVIEEANFLSGAAEWKEIKLLERVDADEFIDIDREALHLIMQNLISNAIKYSQPGQKVEVYSEPYGIDSVVIGVADQAGGMSPETANRIFSPGNHPNLAGTYEEKGTGIGLLLAQDLAEQMGSEIQLETDTKGSRFFLIFPVSTPKE